MSSISSTAISMERATASGRIYVVMGAVAVLTAFIGFGPTYWLRLAEGTLRTSPIVHFHAAAFFAWTLFFLLQATLAYRGRLASHRAFGLLGISIATAMVILATQAQAYSLARGLRAGFGQSATSLTLISITDVFLFATLVAVAVVHVRKPEIHKRTMLMATAVILGAPIVRLIRTFIYAGPIGPPTGSIVLAGTLVADVMILAGLLHDWRTRGRPHAAYVIGGGAVLFIQLARMPIASSSAWHTFLIT
jgi:hypothetical protein